MANDPQGLIYFTGIRSLLSGSFTLSHGVSPSTATIYIPPQETPLPSIGTLQLTYGNVVILFPDCRLKSCDFDVTNSGQTTWALTIQDTRWRWKRGRISGEYNLKRADAEPRPETIRTPQQLLTLLFNACGVKKFDLGQVPNNIFPEKIWEYHRADSELATLVDELGCRIVLAPGNVVRVCRSGFGAPLPLGADVLDNSLNITPADRPDVLRFVGGRKLYQPDLRLEAVAADLDGNIKPIDALSYKPAAGWQTFDTTTGNTVLDPRARELALRGVFKVYRIKAPFLFDGEMLELNRVLPITDKQVITHTIDGQQEADSAIVFGRYCPGHANPVNNVAAVNGDVFGRPALVFDRGFHIDVEKALISFEEPVYASVLVERPTTSYMKLEPELYLRTAISVRDDKTRAWRHYEQDLVIPGPRNGSLPEHLIHDDVVAKAWGLWVGGALVRKDNFVDVKAQADHYLAAALAAFLDRTPGSITYAGLKMIAPDGAIQQVSWVISDRGEARTRASRNRDEPAPGGTFAERRFQEKIIALLHPPRNPDVPR